MELRKEMNSGQRGQEKILAINPGSTSTKIAYFCGEDIVFKKNIEHNAKTLSAFGSVEAQLPYRKELIEQTVKEAGCSLEECIAFSGRGGGLVSCNSGVYEVNDCMLKDAKSGQYDGYHPASLGSQLAYKFAQQYHGRAFVVNPPSVDEFQDIARITGIAGVYRECNTHALNQKETAMRVCTDRGVNYYNVNLIVAHIGGGVSVTAHQKGVMIDSNDNISGEGPMAPTRIGSIKVKTILDLLTSQKYTVSDLHEFCSKKGGFVSHLGTSDMLEIKQRIANGDRYAKLVYDAFCYQISKEIGAMAAVLHGNVDLLIFTGGISNDTQLIKQLKECVGFIAPIEVRGGEFEMEALASGALRVLRGTELVKEYTGKPSFSDFLSFIDKIKKINLSKAYF